MTDEKIGKSIYIHSAILGVFALCVALALGLVDLATSDAITEQRLKAEREALQAVFPESLHDNDLLQNRFVINSASSDYLSVELLGLQPDGTAYKGLVDGEVNGIILPAIAPDGYSGAISLLVGITEDGTLSGVRVVSHRETPGLGDKIDIRVSDWITGFDGRSLSRPERSRWKVRKDGGEFDQFTGATITPRAVVSTVYNTLEFFRLNREALLTP